MTFKPLSPKPKFQGFHVLSFLLSFPLHLLKMIRLKVHAIRKQVGSSHVAAPIFSPILSPITLKNKPAASSFHRLSPAEPLTLSMCHRVARNLSRYTLNASTNFVLNSNSKNLQLSFPPPIFLSTKSVSLARGSKRFLSSKTAPIVAKSLLCKRPTETISDHMSYAKMPPTQPSASTDSSLIEEKTSQRGMNNKS